MPKTWESKSQQFVKAWSLGTWVLFQLSPYTPIDEIFDVQQQMVNNFSLRENFCLCWSQCFWSINHWGIFQQECHSKCCSGATCSVHYLFSGLWAFYFYCLFKHLSIAHCFSTSSVPEKDHWFCLGVSFNQSNMSLPVSPQAQNSVLFVALAPHRIISSC